MKNRKDKKLKELEDILAVESVLKSELAKAETDFAIAEFKRDSIKSAYEKLLKLKTSLARIKNDKRKAS